MRCTVNDERSAREFDRRELLRRVAAVAAATSMSGFERVEAQQGAE